MRLADGTYDIAGSPYKTDTDIRHRWTIADMCCLMGDVLSLSRKDPEIENPKVVLVPLLKKRLSLVDSFDGTVSDGYDINALEEVRSDGELVAFRLPVRENGEIIFYLTVSLSGTDTSSLLKLSLMDGTAIFARIDKVGDIEEEETLSGREDKDNRVVEEIPRRTILSLEVSKISASLRKMLDEEAKLPPEKAVLVLGIMDKLIENAVDSTAVRLDRENSKALPGESVKVRALLFSLSKRTELPFPSFPFQTI
ncbi:MAG TPA: hypothetical protein PKZ41_00265 [Candidatus Omnitrophota bacterium]|nr:hypothetical protein [Candidatus Omnitrophota bacterium]